MLPQRVTRFVSVIAFVLAFLFLGYKLRSRYTDPFYVNFDDGSSWPVLQEQSPTTGFDKVVVMAKMPTEDTDWVARDLPDWGHAIYHMDDPASDYHPPENKGREAMAYLTYLVDMYDSLPSTIAFIHPHEAGWPQAWHTDAEDYSNAKSLQSLKIDYIQKHGYANLRCLESPGCPDEIQPFRDPYDEGRSAEHAFAEAYIFMFGGDNSTVPQVFATPCCSQLAVANWQVRERSKSQYERARQWILDTPLDDEVSGRVMEYIWHVMFGRSPVHCPDVHTCWCEQFGRCGW